MFVCKKNDSLFGSNEEFGQYSVKNADIRIKLIIPLKSWIRFLLKRIQKSSIRYSVDKKPNTFLNYSDSVIRNEYQWQNIPMRFLITPIWFTAMWDGIRRILSIYSANILPLKFYHCWSKMTKSCLKSGRYYQKIGIKQRPYIFTKKHTTGVECNFLSSYEQFLMPLVCFSKVSGVCQNLLRVFQESF